MALRLSPFATVDKQFVIGRLEATGSRDPDVLEQERARMLSAARTGWIAGAALVSIGVTLWITGAGMFAGVPVLAVAVWLMYRGKRNADAIESGFAEFVRSPGL